MYDETTSLAVYYQQNNYYLSISIFELVIIPSRRHLIVLKFNTIFNILNLI